VKERRGEGEGEGGEGGESIRRRRREREEKEKERRRRTLMMVELWQLYKSNPFSWNDALLPDMVIPLEFSMKTPPPKLVQSVNSAAVTNIFSQGAFLVRDWGSTQL